MASLTLVYNCANNHAQGVDVMADGLYRLLMYIVEHPLMESESREAELGASAVQDVSGEIARISEDQRADADRLAPFFTEGIKRAAAMGGQVTVDDTDPTGNGIADAFARFLVTTGLASSESHGIADGHYRYKFVVDLPKLEKLASQAGIDFRAALAGER
jgi:hypothetical protein